MSLGGDEGAALLTKFGLMDQAIDYAADSGAFAHAFDLATASAKHKLPELHLKFAMFLEDEGMFFLYLFSKERHTVLSLGLLSKGH